MYDALQRYMGFDFASNPARRESKESFDVNRGLNLMYV